LCGYKGKGRDIEAGWSKDNEPSSSREMLCENQNVENMTKYLSTSIDVNVDG
jgi:hypothetical protein